MRLVVATPAEKKPAAPNSKTAPTVEVQRQGGGGTKVLVGLGVLLVLVVGVAVGWETFRAKMEERMKGQGSEERLTGDVPLGPPGQRRDNRKSREVGPNAESNVVPAEEEDLALPEKKQKPKPPPQTQVALSSLPPAERAWRSVKVDFEKLQNTNESTAKKYRMKMNVLEDQRDRLSEPAFVKEAGVLDEQLRAELAKPENQ